MKPGLTKSWLTAGWRVGMVVMDQLEARLIEFFGFDSFRPGQREVIERLLQGRHTLAVLPTGSGKSLCYLDVH